MEIFICLFIDFCAAQIPQYWKENLREKKYTEHKILLLTNWRTSEHICRNMSIQEIWLLFYQEEIFPCCCFSSSSFFPTQKEQKENVYKYNVRDFISVECL